MRVAAKDLLVGDTCAGSGQMVMMRPVPSAEPGRVALVTRTRRTRKDPHGRLRTCHWNARTMIGVRRPDLTGDDTHPDVPSYDPSQGGQP